MPITPEIVAHTARLSELELTDEEAQRMLQDLSAVLDYVAKLDELDTTDVPATAHVVQLATPLRPDEVRDVLPVEEAVRNAPEHDSHAMIVPKVVE